MAQEARLPPTRTPGRTRRPSPAPATSGRQAQARKEPSRSTQEESRGGPTLRTTTRTGKRAPKAPRPAKGAKAQTSQNGEPGPWLIVR
eukprot:9121178-Heterocapsa_arctica.AAC.1